MRKKTDTDIIQLFNEFKMNILEKRPSTEYMFEEIRMMRFKIKPLQGNVALINVRNAQFVELIWSLGKLDEFFQAEIKRIPDTQKELFFRFFENLHNGFQDQLNRLNLKTGKHSKPEVLEVEIFRETQYKKKPN